jgi:hypothetical protein
MPPYEGGRKKEEDGMKTKAIVRLITTLLVATMVFAAVPVKASPDLVETTLYAGQTIDVGTVTVLDDGSYLYVKYSTTGGWYLTETHLAVVVAAGDYPSEIPQTKTGNPIPGRFPYKMTHNPAVTEYTYTIEFSKIGAKAGDTLYIAAQAEVIRVSGDGTVLQWETAWADGDGFSGANWATYFTYPEQAPQVE